MSINVQLPSVGSNFYPAPDGLQPSIFTKNLRNIACDECKRRKIRCSADPVYSSRARDKKTCVYSTPTHRLGALQRTVHQYEALIESINKIWAVHVPYLSLEDALKRGPGTQSASHGELSTPHTDTNITQPSPGLHELSMRPQ